MSKDTMTPKERWLAVLAHQKPDRIPMDFWGTDEVTEGLMKHFGADTREEMLKYLNVDFVVSVDPQYVGPPLPKNMDVYGVQYREVQYGEGSYSEVIGSPLAHYTTVEEIITNYNWPQIDWWDFQRIPEQIKGFEEYPIQGGGSEPFLLYKSMRGEAQAFMDLVMHPDIVEYCLGKLFDLAYETTTRIYEAIPDKVTLSYIAEDLGGQRNLLYSPEHIRQFLFPGMKRMIDLVHEAGAFAFHHDDGNIMRIIPELIDLGIDILNPIQWRAEGMERETLKNKFGNQLVFHGGVDNQHTLPFGTVEDVENEVLDNLRILGAEGTGYILAPCHNIQPGTPVENIVAIYETGFNARQI